MGNLNQIIYNINQKLQALKLAVRETEKQASAFNEEKQIVLDRAEKLADLLIANHRIRPEQRKETIEKLASHSDALAMFWAIEKQRQNNAAANEIGRLIGPDRSRGGIPSQKDIIARAQEAFKAQLFS